MIDVTNIFCSNLWGYATAIYPFGFPLLGSLAVGESEFGVSPPFFSLIRGKNSYNRLGVVAVPTLIFARNSVNRELWFATVGTIVSSFFGLGELVSQVANVKS
jgi:hypothetical protein